jgi:hypothetical protein
MPLHYSLIGIELWVRAPLRPTGTKETHPHPAARKLMIPRDRFFWWYSGALLLLGPFGFVVGLLIAGRASRKATLGHPVKARVTQATDTGFAWWQRWVMASPTQLGALWVFGLLSGLLMFLLVLYSLITVPQL